MSHGEWPLVVLEKGRSLPLGELALRPGRMYALASWGPPLPPVFWNAAITLSQTPLLATATHFTLKERPPSEGCPGIAPAGELAWPS
jgi:hypothetical protein